MAVKVVDASALAALIFNEDNADPVDELVAGATLVAPALLGFELANVCLTKLRRSPDQRHAILEQFSAGATLAIETREIDHMEALLLAEQFRLTAYDASYLWLARELDADLVTLDRLLARAAADLRR